MTDNTMAKRKTTKGQTMIYKTLHKILKMEQNKPHLKQGVNSGAQDGSAVPASLVAPIMVLEIKSN